MMVLRYAYLAGPGVNCVGAHNGGGLDLRLLVIYKMTIVYRLYLVFHRACSWLVLLQGVLQARVN